LHVRSSLDYPKEVPVKQELPPRPIAISIEDATDAKQMGYGLRAWGTVNSNLKIRKIEKYSNWIFTIVYFCVILK
jgi:hypothetical protein